MEKKRSNDTLWRSAFSSGRIVRSGALMKKESAKMTNVATEQILMASVNSCAAVRFMAMNGPMAEAIVTPSVK